MINERKVDVNFPLIKIHFVVESHELFEELVKKASCDQKRIQKRKLNIFILQIYYSFDRKFLNVRKPGSRDVLQLTLKRQLSKGESTVNRKKSAEKRSRRKVKASENSHAPTIF